MHVQTTETAVLRTVKAMTIVLACSIGYAAGAAEQATVGSPWPTAVHVDVANTSIAHQPSKPILVAQPQPIAPKRIEKLL
ncbi:hypothetical protein N825_15280 [Skermanella stibiiresistens SB22]|uniref:Uncharacterized protein n=1 Tax=Skermanella stibiiresistens SB22 TaxID=1385369 RepID=W9GVZ3_9PROT|nr:hypothetical protein [Skermanella stibiiresistens]EWY38080.1 hypothetical protein N825_15280 [Skermanella stibiiresistens SB22]